MLFISCLLNVLCFLRWGQLLFTLFPENCLLIKLLNSWGPLRNSGLLHFNRGTPSVNNGHRPNGGYAKSLPDIDHYCPHCLTIAYGEIAPIAGY